MTVFKKIRHLYFKVVGFFLAGNPATEVCSNPHRIKPNQFTLIFTSTFYE